MSHIVVKQQFSFRNTLNWFPLLLTYTFLDLTNPSGYSMNGLILPPLGITPFTEKHQILSSMLLLRFVKCNSLCIQ